MKGEIEMHFSIQVFQVVLTTVIAVLAVLIAYFQWRTAHEKVVIDLFDRRMKIYTECQKILHKIVASPKAATDENGHEFKGAANDAEFLFGDEVVRRFEKVEKAIFDLTTYNAELNGDTPKNEHKELVEKWRIAIDEIAAFYKKDFRSLLRPYMQLNQKLRQWRPLSL